MTGRQLQLRNMHYKDRARKIHGKKGHDNTITPTVLGQILKTSTCRYCKCGVWSTLRTLDHVTPLSRGGLHTIENVVMACDRCNNRKGCLTEEEFLLLNHNTPKLKQYRDKVDYILQCRRRIENRLRAKH